MLHGKITDLRMHEKISYVQKLMSLSGGLLIIIIISIIVSEFM